MNKISRLTIRYMKKNLKREITTLVAIILSTLLIYFVFALGDGYYKGEKNKAYKENFSMDAVFFTDKKTAMDMVSIAPGYENRGINSDVKLENAFYITLVDDAGIYGVNDISKLPADIIDKGNLPCEESEVLAANYINSEGAYVGGDYKFIYYWDLNGDEPNEPGDLELKYTQKKIAGFLKPNYSPEIINAEGTGIEGLSGLTVLSGDSALSDSCLVYVKFSREKDIAEKTKKLAKQFGITAYTESYNASCLYDTFSYDREEYMINMLLYMIIATFVAYIAMIIIRNAFNISVKEREKDYGTLRLIGMTKKQITKIILSEASILSISGYVIGIVIGQGIVFLAEAVINSIIESLGAILYIKLNPVILLVAFLYVLAITSVSVINPIEILYKLNPIEALRGLSGKAISEKKITGGRKLDKGRIEIAYARRNNRRDRRRNIVSIITIAVGVFLVIGIGTGFKSFEKAVNRGILGEYNNSVIFSNCLDNMLKLNEELTDTDYVDKTTVMRNQVYIKRTTTNIKEAYFFMGLEDDDFDAVLAAAGIEEKEGEGLGVIRVYVSSESPENKEKENGDDYKAGMIKTGDTFTIPGTDGEKAHILGNIDEYTFDRIKKEALKISGYSFNGYYYRLSDKSIELRGDLIQNGEYEAIYMDGEEYEIVNNNYIVFVKLKDFMAYKKYDEYIKKSEYVVSEEGMEDIIYVAKSAEVVRIILIFVVGMIYLICVTNIINVKYASYMQRLDELRILRCIGLSKKQKKKLLYYENFYTIFYAGIIGALLGVIGGNLVPNSILRAAGMEGFYIALDLPIVIVTLIILIITSVIVTKVISKEK